MAYETVKVNRYYDGSIKAHTNKNHSDDLNNFHIPLERMHNSNLHDCGIARGLTVEVSIDHTAIIVNPGVAIDSIGQLISLSDTGNGDIGENQPGNENNKVSVPVHLPTASYKGKIVYVTIQFSQILRDNEGVLGIFEQVPWVRLQPYDTFESTFDGKSIVLAIAVIDEDGKLAQLVANPAELKNVNKPPSYCRHLIGECIGELRLRRSCNVENKVQDMLSGKIGPEDAGGLKITVPDTQDSILFAREDGSSFSSLGINANVGIGAANSSAKLEVNGDIKGNANLSIDGNVGIGIPSPSEKLEVSGTVKATAFMGDGYGITALNGEKITSGTIDDARIPTTISRESRFDPSKGHKHTGVAGDGPKISHSNLGDVLEVDPALSDTYKNKHISNNLAKRWNDHVMNKSGNPHGTTAAMLSDYLTKLSSKYITLDESVVNGTQIIEKVGFVPKLMLITGGFYVNFGGNGFYGGPLSGFWTPNSGGGFSRPGIIKTSKEILNMCVNTGDSFSINISNQDASVGLRKKGELIYCGFDFSKDGDMTVTIHRVENRDSDPLDKSVTFRIGLSILCIG